MCTQLKIHDIKSLVFLVPEVSLAQFYFLFDGPGMSFVEGIVCPQASQTCCDTPPLVERTFPGSTSFSAFVEMMAAVRDLEEGKVSFWVHHLNGMYYHQSSCVVSQLLNVLTFMGGVEMGDGSDGSGDWGLYPSLLSSSVWSTTVMVARILNGLGGRFKSFKLGGTIGSCRPKP